MAHNQDWREWLESLNASGVEYVVVGGIALAHHGVVQLGFPPGRIDVLTSIDGLTWDEVDAGAVAGDYGGVPVRFISRADLIRNKRAAGRPQDIADVERLGG